jgi:hypothetical protein
MQTENISTAEYESMCEIALVNFNNDETEKKPQGWQNPPFLPNKHAQEKGTFTNNKNCQENQQKPRQTHMRPRGDRINNG